MVVILAYMLLLVSSHGKDMKKDNKQYRLTTSMYVLTSLRCLPAQPAVLAVVLGTHFFQL